VWLSASEDNVLDLAMVKPGRLGQDVFDAVRSEIVGARHIK
jgi:hypothetical protein